MVGTAGRLVTLTLLAALSACGDAEVRSPSESRVWTMNAGLDTRVVQLGSRVEEVTIMLQPNEVASVDLALGPNLVRVFSLECRELGMTALTIRGPSYVEIDAEGVPGDVPGAEARKAWNPKAPEFAQPCAAHVTGTSG